MSFRFFDLPAVAITQVLKFYSLWHLTCLSLCSKTAFYIVKNNRDISTKLTLYVEGGAYISINVFDDDEYPLETKIMDVTHKRFHMEDRKLPKSRILYQKQRFRFSDKVFMSYWDDVKHGVKTVIEYYSNLFNLDVYTVSVTKSTIWMLDYVETRQSSPYAACIKRNHLDDDDLTDEDFRTIILTTNADRYWVLESPPSADFRIDNFQKKLSVFVMEQGTWITIENLMTMDCVHLEIYEKKFTNQELNRFIRHWTEGGSENLKYLKVKPENFNEGEVLANMELRRIPGEQKYKSRFATSLFHGQILMAKHGTLASIFYNAQDGFFIMGVWPDELGVCVTW